MEHNRDLVALEQLRVRTVARLKAAITKWNQTKALIAPIQANTAAIQAQAEKMERLYTAGQADLLKLLSVRQRLSEAENARLDMVWQAIRAYADLPEASGGTPLLGSIPTVPCGLFWGLPHDASAIDRRALVRICSGPRGPGWQESAAGPDRILGSEGCSVPLATQRTAAASQTEGVSPTTARNVLGYPPPTLYSVNSRSSS